MEFAKKLKELRKEKGLTQEELANQLFVSRTLISKYESGAIYPTKENAEKIAQFFNVNLSDLIDSNETISIALNDQETNSNKIHKVLSFLIIYLSTLINILFFLPIVVYSYYDYSHGLPPIIYQKFTLPIVVTINNGNPIVIITFLSFLCNVVLSLISLKFKKVLIIKIINYILFVVNIFLAFFSIIAAYALVNSKVY